MDFRALLNQVLASGGDLTQQVTNTASQQTSGMSDMTKGALGGAAAGSLVTLLLGSKKGRKMGKSVAKLGGTAALGALAYKVFNDYQASQAGAATSAPPTGQGESGQASALPATPPPETEQHSMAVLKAMIAAAKSDGHVDAEERDRISQGVQSMGASPEVQAFVQRELEKPLDPADIASGVSCPEEAAEIYLASVIMVDDQNFMERTYLQELARQLKLQPELVARLEAQLGRDPQGAAQ